MSSGLENWKLAATAMASMLLNEWPGESPAAIVRGWGPLEDDEEEAMDAIEPELVEILNRRGWAFGKVARVRRPEDGPER